MEFHQVTYFLAACDHLNFTRAAEACHVSQPALTVAIRKLEDELGGALFNRESRGLTLTTLGREMRTHLSRIAALRAAARKKARDVIDGAAREIDFGLMCTVGGAALNAAVAEFHRRDETARLVVHDVWREKLLSLLGSGVFHVAVMAQAEPLPEQFQSVLLYEEPMILAMGADNPLATRPSLQLTDLCGAKHVDRLRCEFRKLYMDAHQRLDMNLEVVLSSEREDWLHDAVANGVGASFMPLGVARSAGLVCRRIKDFDVTRRVEVVMLKDQPPSPIVSALIRHLAAWRWETHPTLAPIET